jgi:hypothetical protein
MSRLLLLSVLAAVPAAPAAERPPGWADVTLTAAAHAVAAVGEGESCTELVLDKASRVALMLASPVPHEAWIVRPDGKVLSAGSGGDGLGDWHAFRLNEPDAEAGPLLLPGLGRGDNSLAVIDEPPPGVYHGCVKAHERPSEPTAVAFTMLPASEVRLGLALVEAEALAGRALALGAMLLDGDQPLDKAGMVATVTRAPEDPKEPGEPLRLELSDRGELGDAAAGDGLFSGVFLPERAGRYWVQVRASGWTRDGLEFQRDTGGVIVVREPEPGLEGGCEAEGVDEDGNGLYETLRVWVPASLRGGDWIGLVAELGTEGGRSVSAQTLVRPEEARRGGRELSVDFSGAQVRSLEADGPFSVWSIRLEVITEEDRALRDRAFQACVTPELRRDDFEEREP